MSRLTGRFSRPDRLRDSRDFRRISRTGRRVAGKTFVMLVATPGPGCAPGSRRVGISASRRVGNAVVRNRLKRGVREWFRRRRGSLPGDVDIVVIARSGASQLDSRGIADSLDALASRIRKHGSSSARSTGGRVARSRPSAPVPTSGPSKARR